MELPCRSWWLVHRRRLSLRQRSSCKCSACLVVGYTVLENGESWTNRTLGAKLVRNVVIQCFLWNLMDLVAWSSSVARSTHCMPFWSSPRIMANSCVSPPTRNGRRRLTRPSEPVRVRLHLSRRAPGTFGFEPPDLDIQGTEREKRYTKGMKMKLLKQLNIPLYSFLMFSLNCCSSNRSSNNRASEEMTVL